MNINTTPVRVNIETETDTLKREAFYNMCFITENDLSPRTLEVKVLKDLLDNGFTRESLAYNFCVGVFAQQAIPSVFIRSKRTAESYEDALDADSNDNYYFIVIESKDDVVISNFNDYLTTLSRDKLQFCSSETNNFVGRKLVHYTQEGIPSSDIVQGSTSFSNLYLNKAYKNNLTIPEDTNRKLSEYQEARLAYPEAAWIALCGNSFPSRVQWLYKFLSKVDVYTKPSMSDLSTTSSFILNNKSTVGSGQTCQGIVIQEQVSLDWVRWAIGRKVWTTVYNKGKLNADRGGLEIITNDVKQVLEIAIEEGVIESYDIVNTEINKRDNNVSISFDAVLTHTILNTEISGTLHF